MFGVISDRATMSEPVSVRIMALSVALATTVSNTVCCSQKSRNSSWPIAPPFQRRPVSVSTTHTFTIRSDFTYGNGSRRMLRSAL